MLSELLVLGLPASNEAFSDQPEGHFHQHLEWPGRWLERGSIRARDRVLLASPLGLGGQPVLATLAFAAHAAEAGAPSARARRAARQEALVEAARECIAAAGLPTAGATAPNPDVVLLRIVAPRVEPAQALLRAVWARWRAVAWDLAAPGLRLWRC
jgi:urease accessory protein